jgi:hypothetical protein
MLPGGLHAWPLVQVWSFFLLESHSVAVPLLDGPSQNTP